MEKNFEIEIENKDVESQESVQLPMNFLTFGEIENDDVKIYIKQDVYKALEKFSCSDTGKELGSILLGNYGVEHGKTHVIISDYIEAKYTDASASTLTFTHETWDYIHSEHENKFSDKKIVGWQHTHPNYGIFLSNYDMFIQENFFNLPFQVAYVIDPIQNLRGFFQWKNGKVEKLKGYYIYDDIGKPIKIEQTKVKKEEPKRSKPSKVLNVFTALLCLATVALSFFTASLYKKYEKQLISYDQLRTEISLQNGQIQTQKEEIADIRDMVDNQTTAEDASTTTTVTESNEVPENTPDENYVTFKIYTVSEGDNLYNICVNNKVDYFTYQALILDINGIDNADQIYVGQSILIPIAKTAE